MEDNKNILNQFKNAAEKSEQLSHPINEAIWDKIETKLETKVLKNKNKLWKRIAIAATFLLFISVLTVFLQKENPQSKIQNAVVITDSISNKNNTTIAVADEKPKESIKKEEIITNKILLPNATEILKKNLAKDTSNPVATVETQNYKDNFDAAEKAQSSTDSKKTSRFITPIFEARTVQSAPVYENVQVGKSAASQESSKIQEPPLLILDNKAVTGSSGKKYKNATDDKLNSIGAENLDEVVYLKEPLYVIDGKQYSEKEMYGENPTSPYAPLSDQEIVNVVVLRDKEATKAFGKKGEKGVLIITTKFGKPKPKLPLKNN